MLRGWLILPRFDTRPKALSSMKHLSPCSFTLTATLVRMSSKSQRMVVLSFPCLSWALSLQQALDKLFRGSSLVVP